MSDKGVGGWVGGYGEGGGFYFQPGRQTPPDISVPQPGVAVLISDSGPSLRDLEGKKCTRSEVANGNFFCRVK